MLITDLQENHNIELEVTMGESKMNFGSQIAMFLADTVLIQPIEEDGQVVGFPDSCTVNFYYPHEGKVYTWSNVTVKLVRYDGAPYHMVRLAGESSTMNRRGAYRVYIGEEMTIISFTAEGPKPCKVLVKDLSETGAAFVTHEEYDIGRTVRLIIPMSGRDDLQLSCCIVRKVDNENSRSYIYGCRFNDHNKVLSGYLMRVQQEKQRSKFGSAAVPLTKTGISTKETYGKSSKDDSGTAGLVTVNNRSRR